MEWFKHKTNAHEDPVVSDAWDQFGPEGYVVWFVLLELYGMHYNSTNSEKKLNFSKTFLRRKFRKSWGKVEQILNFYQKFSKLTLEKDELYVSVGIPNFSKIQSNWTRRKNRPTEAPTEGPTEAPTAKNRREENRRERTSTADADLIKKIESICEEIYQSGQFTKVHAFKNKMLKESKNAGALYHTLCQLKKVPHVKEEHAWAYCARIIGVESGNYNEAEFRQKAEKQKRELEEWTTTQ